MRALKAVDKSDVALLVIDATIGVTHQDQRLAERVDGAGCPIVILLNKWELLGTERGRRSSERSSNASCTFLGRSAGAAHQRPHRQGSAIGCWPALQTAVGEYRTRIPTREVNKVIRAAQAAQPAPDGARVLYATQGATDPPTFTLFANREVPTTYMRYLERSTARGIRSRIDPDQDAGPRPEAASGLTAYQVRAGCTRRASDRPMELTNRVACTDCGR